MPSPSSRAFSPPMSTASSTQSNPSPLQIKKVVLEGRSKHDGASLKMYLKLSVAVDNVAPGSSIPLFREDNIRITQSNVHPLDDRSVPYFYSSTDQPLLHKAATALQLGTKSSRHYHTLFPISSPPLDPTHASSSRRNRESTTSTSTPPPNDERYTGFILVSGYNVTLVLPKEFPPRTHSVGTGVESDGDDGNVKEVPSSWSTRSVRRSSSVFHKTCLHMMAGLELFVPYVTTPPKGPFLVSIPVPRCLDNQVKLRISTPPTNSTPTSLPRGSFTSTSSEDDSPGWDFLTDPPVSRKIEKSTRKSPYQQSADDEQSESPSGPSKPGTELIRGAYQSTDVLHVRWAPPLGRRAGVGKMEDGMRRVGIEKTAGKMRCEVLGRDAQGIKLGITYDGVCSALWHPGVATMLGMDIALDVKGRRVSWPEDGTAGWTVSGGSGFGGLYSEAQHQTGISSRRSSLESSASMPFLPTLTTRGSTTASLLRAPLPNHNTPDYSFESAGASPSPATPSPGSSSTYSYSNTPAHDTKLSRPDISPGKSIMLKVNLLKLLPPAKNVFNFNVKGEVVIDAEEVDFVPLPAFRVLSSDKEKVDTVIAIPMAGVVTQIGTQTADGPRRTLHPGEEIRCEDSVGIVLDTQQPLAATMSATTTPDKSRISPHAKSRTQSPRIKLEPVDESVRLSQQLDLPCVLCTVTPMPHSEQHTHYVHVNIPKYALDADVIEFGLAIPQRGTLPISPPTAVKVLQATYAGMRVRAEVLPGGTDTPLLTSSGFDATGKSHIVGEMQFWIVIHLEDIEVDIGDIELVYLVGGGEKTPQSDRNKGKAREEVAFDILLPCFQQPISRYEVEIDCPAKFDPYVKHSTFLNEHKTYTHAFKLTHVDLFAGFFPFLTLSLFPSPESPVKPSKTRQTASTVWRMLQNISTFVLLYLVVSMGSEMRQVRETMNAAARALIGGLPYTDVYWDSSADSASKHWWWPQDPVVTPVTSEAMTTTVTTTVSMMTPTSWEKETITPTTPTINLAEATPVREKPLRPSQTRSDHRMALIPLPAVPLLSWQISPETKEMILKGLRRALHLLRRIVDFPLDPD